MPHLREALALARTVGDQAREGDILGLFGLAALVTRQVNLARQCQEQALALAAPWAMPTRRNSRWND